MMTTPITSICTVIVAAGLFAAWLMTGWYGAGMVLLTWVVLSALAAMVLAMQQADAERLAAQTESRYTCNGTCRGDYRYGFEMWIDQKPYCRPCAREEQAHQVAQGQRQRNGNEAA